MRFSESSITRVVRMLMRLRIMVISLSAKARLLWMNTRISPCFFNSVARLVLLGVVVVLVGVRR